MPSTQYRGGEEGAAAPFFDPSVPPNYPPDLLLEPTHLDIDLTVNVADEQAAGTVTTTVAARGPQADTLVLDAVNMEDLAVEDADGHALTWRYDGQKATIHWQKPFVVGETRRVAVSYRVDKPVDGLVFSKPDEAYPERAWYAVTDHETERARYWLPCLDSPNVRTKLDFHLRAESRFTILANGHLVGERVHEDGTKTAHWHLEQLCPSYLICFAVGDFVAYDDGVFENEEQQVALAYYCTKEHTADHLARSFGRTREMMAWITQKLAMPFPYPKYYQFAVPGISGAMENISLTSWNDKAVQDARLAEETGYGTDLVNLHEMAHSYFGDAIVCRDFAHTWLKESWAVYMEQCWLEDRATSAERDYQYFDDARLYMHEADHRYKRPIVTRRFRSSWEMFDAHTYPGGACRLHTLRHEIGDDVFWQGVRDYLQRYKGKVVETDQFRLIMEEHSGRSLGQFFDQWFYTAGYPDLKVSFSYDEKKEQGTFEIEQRQVDAEKNIPPFTLSCDLGWTIDGQSQRTAIKVERERQTFVVAMPEAPEQVRFDPEGKVLHKLTFNPGDTMLRKQLSEASDVIGRILAAQELAQSRKHSNLQAVVDAYGEEPFWGVRREMATALAKAEHATAVAGLAELVALEKDPMVMAHLFDAAGSYRDGRVLEALLGRLQGDLPYHARRTALEALGKQRQAAPFDLLYEAAKQEGFNGIVQSGALLGLAETRREEAVEPLLARAAYGATPIRARPAAVTALGEIGQGQEKARREEIVEFLSDLLRDRDSHVHPRAARSLLRMKAVEAISALEAYARRLSQQDQVTMGKLLRSLRAEENVDGSALKKQVETLQERLRQLEDRLESLAAAFSVETAETNDKV